MNNMYGWVTMFVSVLSAVWVYTALDMVRKIAAGHCGS